MSKQFSYQSDAFGKVLSISLVGHFLLLGGFSFLIASPQYAVERAPSSMDVVILKEEEIKPKIEEKVIALPPEAEVREQVVQQEEKIKEKKIQKPIFIPEVKGAITEAKPDYLKNPAPVYPAYAREQGWEGLVMLEVEIETDGNTKEVRVVKSSGYKILDNSALKAVRDWKFLPARVGNLSISSQAKIPVRFILEEN